MYLGEKQVFTPVQLATMLFTKLKHTAETAMKTKVIDVVVSVSFKMLLSNVESSSAGLQCNFYSQLASMLGNFIFFMFFKRLLKYFY